jgi:hypothetical protein
MLKTLFQYKMMQSQMQMQSQVPNNTTFYNLPQNIPQMPQMQNFPPIHPMPPMHMMPQRVAPQINSGFPMMAAPQINYGFSPNTYYSPNFNNFMTASTGFPSHPNMTYPAMAYPSFGYNPNNMFQ